MNIREFFTEAALSRLAERLDNQNWFRMLVFVLPPLVLSRLAILLALPPLIQTALTVMVFAGFGAFIVWPKMRARQRAIEDAKQEALDAEEGHQLPPHKAMMERMSLMCGGNVKRVYQYIDYEYEMNGDGDYGHAIETAFRRMRDRYLLQAKKHKAPTQSEASDTEGATENEPPQTKSRM